MIRLSGDRWIALEFKLQDLWIGAFWDWRDAEYHTARGLVVEEFHLWVCLLPCLPIHYVSASHYGWDHRPHPPPPATPADDADTAMETFYGPEPL